MAQTTERRRYMGRRFGQKGIQWWWQYDEEKVTTHSKAPAGPTPIGSTWDFTAEEDGSFYISGEHRPIMVDAGFNDDPQVITWATLDRAAMVEKAERSKAAKAIKDGGFEAILEPIRKVYWAANRTERAAILAVVMQEITSMDHGRTKR